MDMQLLKRATKKITMQNDMQQRLMEKCRTEEVVEPQGYDTVVIDMPVPKMKPSYFRYVFTCLAVIVMLTISGILLYNGVEFKVGTYEKGTEKCTQIIEEMESAFLETKKAGSGKILIAHPNAVGRTMQGDVILDDWRLNQGITNCQYYCFAIGMQQYLKKSQGYYNGYYTKKEDAQWEEDETVLRGYGYDYTYWISYLLLDFCVPSAWYTTENLQEVTVSRKGGETIYLFNYGTYGYRRFIVDHNQVVRKSELLKTDMTIERQCTFDPCEVQQVETPFDEDIEALKKTKLDLDADGVLDHVAVEYLENGVQVTVNDTSMTLNYGEEIPAGYYSVSMTDMKRFLEQDANTGAIILTMQSENAMNTQFFDYTPRIQPVFCVIGYDGTEVYLLGSYQGEEFNVTGADAFYMRRYNEEIFTYEIVEFVYDRKNRVLVQKS